MMWRYSSDILSEELGYGSQSTLYTYVQKRDLLVSP